MTKPTEAALLRAIAIIATVAALLSGSLASAAVASSLQTTPRAQRAEPLTLNNFQVRIAAATECETRTVRATVTVEIVGKTIYTQTISARLSGATASSVSYTPADRYIGQMLPPGTYTVEAVFSNVTVTSADGNFTVIGRAEFDAQRARKEATTAPLSFPPQCDTNPTATATPTTGSTATATPTTGSTATATATATPTTGSTATATPTTGSTVTATPTTGSTVTATPTTGSTATATPSPTATSRSTNPRASLIVALSYDCLSATRSAVAAVTILVENGPLQVEQFVGALEGVSGGTISYSPADIVGQTLQPGSTTVTIQFSGFTPTATLLRATVSATLGGITLADSDVFSTETCVTRPTLTPTARAEQPPLSDVALSAELGYDCANPANAAAAVIRISISGEAATVEQLTATVEGVSGGTTSFTPADKYVGQTLQPGSYELRIDLQGFSLSGDRLQLSVDGRFSGKQRAASASFSRSERCSAAPPTPAPANPTAASGSAAPPTPESGSAAPPTPERSAPDTSPAPPAGAAGQRQDVAGASGSDETATSDQAAALLPATGVGSLSTLIGLTLALLLIALGSGLRAARLRRR